MHSAEGELEEMPKNESEEDRAAPQHGAGGVGGVNIGFLDVLYWPGFALQEPKLE